MANTDLNVILRLKDELTARMKGITTSFQTFGRKAGDVLRAVRQNWLLVTAAIAGAVYSIKKVSDAFIGAAATSENFAVRLKSLLGSVQEGNRLFKEMSKFAGQVPFEYAEIMEAATALSGVVRGGVDEVVQWMPLIADLAAVSGLSLRVTMSQFIRMYSAGAAAADTFRERGILQMLGFQAGVKYTTEETRQMMIAAWTDVNSKFRGATNDLAKTWHGLMSMFSDAWFQFRNDVMEAGLFDDIKTDLKAVLNLIAASKEEGGKYSHIIENISNFFREAYDNSKDFLLSTLVAGAQLVDVWNDVRLNILGAYGAVLLWFKGTAEFGDKLAESKGTGWLMKLIYGEKTIEENKADLARLEAEVLRIADETNEAIVQSGVDYSTQMKERIEAFKNALAEMRTATFGEGGAGIDIAIIPDIEGEIKEATKIISANLKKIGEQAEDIANKVGDTIGRAFDYIAIRGQSINEFLTSLWQTMASNFITNVTKMIVKWIAFQTLLRSSGGGGFLGKFLGMFFHEGGEVERPTIKAHSGLAIDEVPIIAQTGEGILSRRGMAALGGAGMLNRLNAGGTTYGATNIYIDNANFNNDADTEDTLLTISRLIEQRRRARI